LGRVWLDKKIRKLDALVRKFGRTRISFSGTSRNKNLQEQVLKKVELPKKRLFNILAYS
jgi:hypothetical protein